MCTKTQNSENKYCHGCEFHCTLGAQRKPFSFPAKYYPTVNCKKLIVYTDINGKEQNAITKTKEHAIARARIHVQLTENLCAHFEQMVFLMDCYTVLAAKLSKYKNPINDVGVTEVYGIDHPELFQHGEFVYVKEHVMIPQKYIDALTGLEKYIFGKLYAGRFSQKLYRLFEYRKV